MSVCAYGGLKMKYSKLEETVTEKLATISKLMVKNNKLEDEKRKMKILLSLRARNSESLVKELQDWRIVLNF